MGDCQDREVLAALFDGSARRLYRLARRLTSDGEEARDLVQETFLRAARNVARLPREPQAGERWLMRTMVNLCRDHWRRQRVRRRRPAQPPDEPALSPESAAVARATVSTALGALSPRRRAVTVLHHLEDRSTAEIASLLGISQVTVRWHLAAARRQLARTLAPGQENDS